MDTTWAVISWSVPSYIPVAYPIITYEIGYHVLQSDNCLLVDTNSINTQLIQLVNVSRDSTSTNITGLTANTCYLFSVRAYTTNGHGLWRVTANDTLVPVCRISESSMTSRLDSILTSLSLNRYMYFINQ